MHNKLTITVAPEAEGMKMIHYLMDNQGLSRRFCKHISKQKRLNLNQQVVDLGVYLHEGDIIDIVLEETKGQDYEAEAMELDIIYEDADILVVNKPAYMLVHPTKNHAHGTLVQGILYHFKQNQENCIVRLVSRLDRDTKGLILIAKNDYAHMQLARMMDEIRIQKIYEGLVYGELEPKEGTIDLPIMLVEEERDPHQESNPHQESETSNPNKGRRQVHEAGQPSITHYKTLACNQNISHIQLMLETGRTHQIRVHLSHVGHPLVGDKLYNESENNDIFNHQALCATRLVFEHPRTKAPIDLKIDSGFGCYLSEHN